MDTQRAGCAGLIVNLGEEAQTLLACRGDRPDLPEKAQKLRMFVRPAPGAYVGPELRLVRTDTAHLDIGVVCSRGHLNWPIEHVADLDRFVIPGAQQVERRDAR